MCCLLNSDKAILVTHPTDKGDSYAGITNKVLSMPGSPRNLKKNEM